MARPSTPDASDLLLAANNCSGHPRQEADPLAALAMPFPAYGASERATMEAIRGARRDRIVLPVGAPVNVSTSTAVIETLTGFYACLAENDPLRAATFVTDDFLRAPVVSDWTDRETRPYPTQPADGPVLAPGSRLTIASVRIIPGGRVGALVEITSAARITRRTIWC